MPADPAEPDPLLDRPAWAPAWLPTVDDFRAMRALRWVVVVVFLAGLGACVSRGADSPADPVLAPEPSTEPAPTGTGDLSASPTTGQAGSGAELASIFGTVVAELVSVSGEVVELCLLHADTAEERGRGLMGVTDLQGHDGMAFTHGEPVDHPFFMYRTPLPLTVAWWDSAGDFVSASDMAPCPAEDPAECPRFPPGGPYQVALEVPQASPLAQAFAPGAALRVGADSCRALA